MLHPDLFTRLDLLAATQRELSSKYRLLPQRLDYLALASSANEVAKWLTPRLRKGHSGTIADVVFADKGWRGTRPLSVMSLDDRILYRALVDLLAPSLPDEIRSRSPFSAFQHEPLSVDDARYVTKTDVTAYYEYVDHELLADELTAQTGEELAIGVLVELLSAMMGRRIGLPQVHGASDVLGDTYIDPVRRRLIRRGYIVFRYSDDFRIASRTLGSARAAIETCAVEARKLGLVLNERKTYTYRTPKYNDSLTSFVEAERRLFTDADHTDDDLSLLTEGYGDDGESQIEEDMILRLGERPIDRTVDDEEVIGDDGTLLNDNVARGRRALAARRAWDIWFEEEESEDVQSSQRAAITQSLLGRALPILGADEDGEPLANIEQLMRYEPALAPQIAAYIDSYSSTGQKAKAEIRAMLDRVTGKEIISAWQGMWLAYAAGSVGRSRRSSQNRPFIEWLVKCVNGPHPGLSATAAATLGRIGVGDPSEFAAALDRVGPEWRLLVLWGFARLDHATAEKYAENQLDRLLLASMGNLWTLG